MHPYFRSMEFLGTMAKYDNVGHCIYCGQFSPNLTDEHVIPKGLKGNLVLPKSSCSDCQKITCKLENYCLRQVFGAFRLKTGLSKKKDRPRHLRLHVLDDDRKVVIKDVPVSEYPLSLAMARFPPPGILVDRPADADFDWEPWFWADHNSVEAVRRTHGGAGFQSHEFHPEMFCRMIAKISHAYAVAEIGTLSFAPMLRDLILSGNDKPYRIVGGDIDVIEATQALHEVQLRWQPHRGTEFLVATVRLFAFLGTPVYHAVVGLRR